MTPSAQRYATSQIILHWLTLLVLLASFISHDWMKAAWRFVNQNPTAAFSADLGVRVHTIAGITVLVLTLIRIVLKLTKGAPAPAVGQNPMITRASKALHGLLYVVLLALPLSGIAAWGGGITQAADVHEVLFNVGLALVALHVVAAIYHQFIVKDNLMARMWR